MSNESVPGEDPAVQVAEILKGTETNALAVRDADNRIRGVVTTDSLTAAVEASKAKPPLSQTHNNAANDWKKDFAAWFGHEMRVSVGSIIGCVEVLNGQINDAKLRELLQIIRRSSQTLLNLLNDMADNCKYDTGQIRIRPSKVRIAAVIYEIFQLMRVPAEEKQIDLTVEFASSIPEIIETDLRRLHQILANLVANAIMFTDRGTVIIRCSFTSELDKPTFRCDVVDTGPGISDEKLPCVFAPFPEARHVERDHRMGSGLGLPICKTLAELLGGTIEVASVPEVGSTFSLLLHPANWNRLIDHFRNQICALPDFESSPLHGKRFLVVDDQPDSCVVVEILLGMFRAQVETAENGHVALTLIQTASSEDRPFDAIVMDMHMPILDGYATTRRLRQYGDETPILALTASASAEEQANCFIAGCSSYLCKPIDAATLIRALSALVQPQACSVAGDLQR